MKGAAVEAVGVWKSIGGRPVLRGVNIKVPEGSVYVLAGPNGSGKTTTIRVLLGLIRRDSGTVKILGVDPESGEWPSVRRLVGYMPEDAQPYERLTGLEHIVFYARAYGINENPRDLAKKASEISGLTLDKLNSRVSSYSKGMKRRLLLAATLIHSPKLAILDEPTSGLDVISAYNVKRLIKSMKAKGATFIITTHDLKEAEEIADLVAFISEGFIVAEGGPRELMEAYGAESLEEAYVRAVGDDRI